MKIHPAKPVRQLIAGWVCLGVYLLFASGLLAWCGGLYSVLEGNHGVSVRMENQQWVVVLDHDSNVRMPSPVPHQHDLMTGIITAFSVNSAEEANHYLSGQKCDLVMDDQGATIPLPPVFCIESNPTLDYPEPWAFANCNDVSPCLEHVELIQVTCIVHIPAVRMII
jgi:hypothetical protein